jgi:S-(hydroxymethyl)glutathione dehydrogenase / alcohol dehydrogenase
VVSDGSGGFAVEAIEVDEPGPGEVLVEIKASGVCHTDNDLTRVPVPLVLGHEGAGIVAATGEGVTGLVAGDRVVLSWAIPCGRCFYCVAGEQHLCEAQSPLAGLGGHAHISGTRRANGDSVVRAFSLGTMSTHALVRAEAVVPLPDGVPFTSACITGCGVMTGFGSVVNVARVVPGASVVVLGCGGVGLNVIQTARIAGATSIIAVDPKPSRLEMAVRFGATATLEPSATTLTCPAWPSECAPRPTDGAPTTPSSAPRCRRWERHPWPWSATGGPRSR